MIILFKVRVFLKAVINPSIFPSKNKEQLTVYVFVQIFKASNCISYL